MFSMMQTVDLLLLHKIGKLDQVFPTLYVLRPVRVYVEGSSCAIYDKATRNDDSCIRPCDSSHCAYTSRWVNLTHSIGVLATDT
jgi:hypothetical protein